MRNLNPNFCLLITTIFFSYSAFAGNENNKNENNQMQSSTISSDPVLNVNDNPLLPEWTGQYGGVPPFDKIEVSYFIPALEAAMTENLNEIEKITSNSAAPTFENTIAEMERSGKLLDRVRTIYGIWSSNMNNKEFESVETEMEPTLAAFNDKITQNEKLFQRIEAIYNSPTKKNLTSEQQRLTWVYYTNFIHSGSKLDVQSKARVSEINQSLAGLFTKFSQNLLADETNNFLVLKDESDLNGLPQSLKDAAASNAVK